MDDPKGYYKLLGVSSDASPADIKNAFRALAKKWHPDRNDAPDAGKRFQEFNEAYNVLIDYDSRSAYDASSKSFKKAKKTDKKSTPHHKKAGSYKKTDSKKSEFRTCSNCGTVTAQPRFIIFKEIIGRFTKTEVKKSSGVFCRDCANREAIKLSIRTWLKGWWSLKGPILSIKALSENLWGGEKPAKENYELLMDQARAFLLSGKSELAYAIAMQAKKFALTSTQRHRVDNFLTAINQGKKLNLKDRWKTFGRDFILQLAPVFLLTLVAVMAVVDINVFVNMRERRIENNKPWTANDTIGIPVNIYDETKLYHATRDPLVVWYGPGTRFDVLDKLPRGTTVRLTGTVPGTLWVRVMLADGQYGYVRSNYLQKGRGRLKIPFNSRIVPNPGHDG